MSTLSKSPGIFCFIGGVLAIAMLAGCGRSDTPQPRVVTYDYDPVTTVRNYLEGYAGGTPLGSERELFPQFVEAIRKTDPDKAAIVESGLEAIVKSPATARAEAKKLLERL